MACPFLLSRTGFGSASAKNTGQGQASKCPFGFGRKKDEQEEEAPDKEVNEQPPLIPSPKAHLQPARTSPTQPVCPYGYTNNSPSGPAADITCLVCKCFYFDCVRLGCGHSFCRCCIARWQACPSCGADIEHSDVKPDSQLQGQVDKFLSAHLSMLAQAQEAPQQPSEHTGSADATSQAAQLAQVPPALLPAPMLASTPSPAAAFALQLGLQALRGGNPAAALDRLETCKHKLVKALEDAKATDSNSQPSSSAGLTDLPTALCGDVGTRVRAEPPAAVAAAADSSAVATSMPLWSLLGAVYGSQGDACKQLGALSSAARLYTASTACLQRVADQQDDEGMHALSVSVNKLGDVQYMAQDLQAAGTSYQRALHLRLVRLQRALARLATQHTAAHATSQDTSAHTTSQSVQLHQSSAGVTSDVPLPIPEVAAHLQRACVEQALDVVASCIKVADAASSCDNMEPAQQACSDAHLLLSSCISSLQQHEASPEGAPDSALEEEDRDSAHGSGRVGRSSSKASSEKPVGESGVQTLSSSPTGEAMLMARCQQLQAVLAQLELSLR